jgi:hypothetical protein
MQISLYDIHRMEEKKRINAPAPSFPSCHAVYIYCGAFAALPRNPLDCSSPQGEVREPSRLPPGHHFRSTDLSTPLHQDRPHMLRSSIGASTAIEIVIDTSALEIWDVKTLLKPMSVLLKQFDLLTSATCAGSAKMMSTH